MGRKLFFFPFWVLGRCLARGKDSHLWSVMAGSGIEWKIVEGIVYARFFICLPLDGSYFVATI